MIDLHTLRRAIYEKKGNRGFNVTDVGKEIVLMVEELGELAHAYKGSDKRGYRIWQKERSRPRLGGGLRREPSGLAGMNGQRRPGDGATSVKCDSPILVVFTRRFLGYNKYRDDG